MNPQHDTHPNFDSSPFCANDQVFRNASAANHTSQKYDLPGHHDLIGSLHRTGDALKSPLTLAVIGLSLFNVSQFELDDRTLYIGSLGAAARLALCVRRCNEKAIVDNTSDTVQPDLCTQHTVFMTGDPTPRQAELFRLSGAQFAVLTTATASTLSQLCEDMLLSLEQPIYVGQQPLQTSAYLGIARNDQYNGRPESFLRAARSALVASKQK